MCGNFAGIVIKWFNELPLTRVALWRGREAGVKEKKEAKKRKSK